MSKFQDNLNSIFDTKEQALAVQETAGPVAIPEAVQQQEEDLEKSRKALTSIVKVAQEAVEDLAHFAKESESPKAYESLATLVKAATDAAKGIVEIHKIKEDTALTRKNVSGKNVPETLKQTNNTIYVGSTKELSDMIKNNSEILDNT